MIAKDDLPGSTFTGPVAEGIRTAMRAHLSTGDASEVNAIMADLRATYGHFAVDVALVAFGVETYPHGTGCHVPTS